MFVVGTSHNLRDWQWRREKKLNQTFSGSYIPFYLGYYPNFQASLIAQLVKNLPSMQETPIWFLVMKIQWRRDRLPTPVFLGFPGGSADKESAYNVGYLGWSLGWEEPLEKEKATHSSILAWRTPGLYSPWSCKGMDMTEWLSLSLHPNFHF